ncbi:unnamed protein product [Sphagnum troendelagicum]|uniref:Choline transporter-like protein n=1 Tax=Sphagnum troendelagicum TaxID=128251 RepID=A0ABP0U2S5_9BRYO
MYGFDYLGNTCGNKKGSVNLESYNVRYWQNPNQVYRSGVLSDPFNLADARSICLQDCPTPSTTNYLTWVCDYPQGPINLPMVDWAGRNYDYYDLLSPAQKCSSINLTGPCYPVLFQSTNFFWSCELQASPVNETLKLWTDMGGVSINSGDVIVQAVHNALSEPTAVIKRYIADLGRAWPVLVVCGGIVPLLVNYMAHSSALLCGCNYMAYYYPPQCGCSFCHPLLLHQGWMDRYRCNYSCDWVWYQQGLFSFYKCCGKSHWSNSKSCHIPNCSISYFGCVSYILGDCTALTYKCRFINACCLTTIAGAIAAYYGAQGKTSFGWAPVLSSAKRVVQYSLGSMALGSLLVAIIEMIRFIIEFIRKRLKLLELAPGGCCLSLLFCCAQCCLGCIEWIVKFINKNAYIVIATSGKGFCRAAGKASALIVSNILKVAAVNILGDLILFLGKVCVSLVCALFAFLMLETHKYKSGNSQVSSPLFPVLFCWGVGYITAGHFFAVVEMAIDTILLSFCIDADEHNGTAMFAPPLLIDTLRSHARCQEAAQAAHALRKQKKAARGK